MSTAKDFVRIIKSLSDEERKVIKYFITYKSVGELIAIRELKGLYNIKDPAKIITKLINLGIIERGIGCYNISREFLKQVRSGGIRIE